MADDFGLLVDFLRHEVAMVAFVDQHDGGLRLQDRALDDVAAGIVDLRAVAREDHPITVLEIAYGVGERRQRDRIGTDEHLAVAETDRQRRTLAGADQQIVLAGEQECQRERATQPRQRPFDRFDRRRAARHFGGDEMRDDLGIGLGGEFRALAFKLAAQLAEILDDAVVHDGEPLGGVRMRIVLGRPAVGRPARVADADRS